MSDQPRFALRFISGKYQGGEFPLRMNREIVIGRSSELDMVLVEDMVSRRHAKISSTDHELFIQDVGSTNGTFVNGEKIAGVARLAEGDRILVGTSIIKVVAAAQMATEASEAEARRRLEAGAQRQTSATTGRPMSGVIEEIPLPDLMQLLSTSRKSGVLTVNNGVSLGKIYMRKGQIYFAAVNDDFNISPQKSIYRMLTWQTGTFELDASVDMQVMEEVQESTEGLLMEGMRQLDEFMNMARRLPPLGSPLAVPTPLAGKLRELSPGELDTFQLVLDHGSLQKVLDNYPGSDSEAATNLIALMKREFVVVP